MKLNPLAVLMWIFAACVGFLINGFMGAAWGFTVTLGISFLSSLITSVRRSFQELK